MAVGVVEADEATEFLRLLPLMGDETMDLVIMLHRGDMAALKIRRIELDQNNRVMKFKKF